LRRASSRARRRACCCARRCARRGVQPRIGRDDVEGETESLSFDVVRLRRSLLRGVISKIFFLEPRPPFPSVLVPGDTPEQRGGAFLAMCWNNAVLSLAAQVKIESKVRKRFIILQFQAHGSRRFQHGFDRVNLLRPTLMRACSASVSVAAPAVAPAAAPAEV